MYLPWTLLVFFSAFPFVEPADGSSVAALDQVLDDSRETLPQHLAKSPIAQNPKVQTGGDPKASCACSAALVLALFDSPGGAWGAMRRREFSAALCYEDIVHR
ncbi:hypothetical protein ColTof4_14013 [Colletotrichum tofieldiae]|nr:hypothetical protein ColTof3_14646 [Colletotrichum tofieldiae]GKT81590.1 hypothetical protein ColTof4_14013 [Colletotrichum tofieldiae]